MMLRNSDEKLSISEEIFFIRFLKEVIKDNGGNRRAAKPAAVAMSASEMPGATTASVAEPLAPMPRNAVIIPQTVPNSPMKGQALPVVARKPSALSIL